MSELIEVMLGYVCITILCAFFSPYPFVCSISSFAAKHFKPFSSITLIIPLTLYLNLRYLTYYSHTL
ncbi:unnamed protein product [Prunus brigantina]